jgi:hypothetical protein
MGGQIAILPTDNQSGAVCVTAIDKYIISFSFIDLHSMANASFYRTGFQCAFLDML